MLQSCLLFSGSPWLVHSLWTLYSPSLHLYLQSLLWSQFWSRDHGGPFTSAPSETYLGPSNPPLPSLVLPLRPQHPAAMLILLWVATPTPRSRSISHWLSVRSVRPGWLGELEPAPPGCLEEMVRNMWLRLRRKSPPAAFKPKLPLRRTMRVLADLAGRDLWLYSSWDRCEAYPSGMNWHWCCIFLVGLPTM